MGLFSKNKKIQNAVQGNQVDANFQTPPFLNGWDFFNLKKGKRDYASTYLWICLDRIIKGLSNVLFTTSKNEYVSKGICAFVNNNATLLFDQFVRRGYMVVGYDKDLNYQILGQNQIKLDTYGRVINRNAVVVYTPEYQTMRKSPVFMCKPILDILNDLCNTLASTTDSLNVLPIISGNSIPASPSFKENLANAMTKNYGWGEDQMRYFLSQAELSVQTIDLGVDKLQLKDNITAKFKDLLNFWQVPVPLVIDDNSTYNNVSEARREFYNGCIRFYAENLLLLAKNLLTVSDVLLPQTTLNYTFSNVSEMEKTISGYCNEKGAYLELLKRFGECGVAVDDDIQKLYEEVKRQIKEV